MTWPLQRTTGLVLQRAAALPDRARTGATPRCVMLKELPPPLVRVLTVNVHKGYTALRRRFMLHELREAVRAVGGDLVFLQEVIGSARTIPRRRMAQRRARRRTTNSWPTRSGREHAYGRNAVIDGRDHGNALLSRFPIIGFTNHDVSQPGDEARGLLHCVMLPDGGGQLLHAICVHLGLRESHRRRQLDRLLACCEREVPAECAADRGRRLQRLARPRRRRAARLWPGRSVPRRPWRACAQLSRRAGRCCAWTASTCGRCAAARPLPLPRRPWATLSDHAPLAAEIQL